MNPGTEDQIKALMERMKSIPQYAAIERLLAKADIQCWIEFAIKRENSMTRVEWLIDRLSGIGGSEIGVLVSEKRGEVDLFGDTSVDVVQDKLLMAKAMVDNGAMRFGREVEHVIRKMFQEDIEKSGAKFTRRDDLIEKLSSVRHSKHPWMRYSPDDVFDINGKLFVADYKLPAIRYDHNDIPMRYLAQLHQGKILLEEELGCKDVGILLIQCPLQDRTVHATNVTVDESIVADIKECGDRVWFENVLTGEVPTVVRAEGGKLDDADVAEVERLLGEYATLSTIEKQAEKRKEIVKETVALIYRSANSVDAIKLPIASLTVKKKFDIEMAARHLSSNDAINPALMINKIDNKKMEELLAEKGVPRDEYTKAELMLSEELILTELAKRGTPVSNFEYPSTSVRIGSEKNVVGLNAAAAELIEASVAPKNDMPTP